MIGVCLCVGGSCTTAVHVVPIQRINRRLGSVSRESVHRGAHSLFARDPVLLTRMVVRKMKTERGKKKQQLLRQHIYF